MKRFKKHASLSSIIIAGFVLINIAFIAFAITTGYHLLWWLILTIPLLLVAIRDTIQQKHAIIRNYPVIGHLRYFFESIRPEIRQYFIESDLDGKPFNRRQRSIVYQRAKSERQTVAFGMQANPNAPGFEWVSHSVYPTALNHEKLRVWIGNEFCHQPYYASIYIIGAMSYGALSKTAIKALNEGAR